MGTKRSRGTEDKLVFSLIKIKGMTSIKTKKLFIFIVYAFLFMFGGVEYAVILPTLWLYLDNTYNAPEYMLGIVLSAYSLAAFFSAPIIGRISDRTGRTKEILIVCSCIQIIGSCLYTVGISQWLCVASRFICGIGGAAEAVALAEVARYTPEEELTGVISKIVAMRQISLVGAPGLNIVLRLADFDIGPINVNKYTVPGAFMVVLWILFIIITCAFYTEPRDVHNEEKKLKKSEKEEEKNRLVNKPVDIVDNSVNEEHDAVPRNNRLVNGSEENKATPEIVRFNNENNQAYENFPTSDDLGTSYEVMASAERLICSSELYGQIETLEDPSNVDFVAGDSWSLIDADEIMSPLILSGERGIDPGKSNSSDIQTSANNDYIENHISYMDNLIVKEGKLGFFCKEYIRDNVMAIITLLFCALFSQIALEAMCTPLSYEYMDFGELENSILYCLCGVEIIFVFLIVSVMSKCVEDRKMIFFGGFLLLTANVWLIVFLPSAPRHDRSHNLPYLALAVGLDVMSLPFLLVCASSLYAKMTRKETQGLSQGLRRGVTGMGTILAPMWASSIVKMPYLILGVLIGIQSLSLLLCLLSYNRLVALDPEIRRPSVAVSKQRPKPRNVARSDNHPTNNVDVNARSAVVSQSSQYGSISTLDSAQSPYVNIKT